MKTIISLMDVGSVQCKVLSQQVSGQCLRSAWTQDSWLDQAASLWLRPATSVMSGLGQATRLLWARLPHL